MFLKLNELFYFFINYRWIRCMKKIKLSRIKMYRMDWKIQFQCPKLKLSKREECPRSKKCWASGWKWQRAISRGENSKIIWWKSGMERQKTDEKLKLKLNKTPRWEKENREVTYWKCKILKWLKAESVKSWN